MRVVIDLRWMRPGVAGGIENLSRSFLGELLALNHVGHWTVLVPAEVAYDFDLRHREDVRVEAFDGPGRAAALLSRRATRGAGGFSPRAPDAVLSLSGYINADMFRYRNVLVFHDLQHEYYPQFFAPAELDERKRVFSESLRRADRVIAVSEYTRRTILERFGFAPERVTTAHEAADPRFHPDRWRPDDLPRVLAKYALRHGEYLLFPAHTWHHKNHQGALEALAVVRARTGLRPPLVLTGAPREGHPGLLETAGRLGVLEQVRFLGYCPPDDVPALYRGAASLFYPSLFEGFGIPLVEAMWCRCPIVCSNATCLPEVAGDAALLADPRSPEALADALARVLTDTGLRADLVARGIRRARQFSWRRFTTEVLRSLDEVSRALGSPPPPGAAAAGLPLAARGARPRQACCGSPPPVALRDLPAPPTGRTGWPWTEEAPPLPDVRPDGTPWPAISVVTPADHCAGDLEATLRSVLLQGYPRLECVVVGDGMCEGAGEILDRYGRWLARDAGEANRGPGRAMTRGFERAGGDVLAYLTPDALLRPGALAAAACALDPRRDRHVAVGRCSFIDATGRPLGVEHPSQPLGLERILAVWKGRTFPQPSTFWTREAWRACGPIESGNAGDYDLCCRLATRYRFHSIDRVLSSYCLPFDPLAPMPGTWDAIGETIEVSRRYWGPRWAPRYWRLAASLATYRLDRRRRGLAILRRAADEGRRRRLGLAVIHGAVALALAPETVFVCAIYPRLRERAPRRLKRAFTPGGAGRA